MSWDIFVYDIPADARSLDDIPHDFQPKPIGSYSDIVAKIKEVCPEADFGDPDWGQIATRDFVIEVNLQDENPLMDFAFHVYGGGAAAGLIAAILDKLGLRAYDPNSESGLLDRCDAEESFRDWQAYRDHVGNMMNRPKE